MSVLAANFIRHYEQEFKRLKGGVLIYIDVAATASE